MRGRRRVGQLAGGALAVALAAACTGPRIDTRFQAVSQDSRVQFIIVHYTEIDFDHSLRRLTREEVSSHYLVAERPPTIYRLVDESRRAWHAGLDEATLAALRAFQMRYRPSRYDGAADAETAALFDVCTRENGWLLRAPDGQWHPYRAPS